MLWFQSILVKEAPGIKKLRSVKYNIITHDCEIFVPHDQYELALTECVCNRKPYNMKSMEFVLSFNYNKAAYNIKNYCII